MNGRADRERRRKEAEERNSKWASFTFEQQISKLDEMFGKGVGAKKQRTKIQKKIEKKGN